MQFVKTKESAKELSQIIEDVLGVTEGRICGCAQGRGRSDDDDDDDMHA